MQHVMRDAVQLAADGLGVLHRDFGGTLSRRSMPLNQLLVNPRIDYLDPTVLKVLHISSGERSATGASY